MRRFEYFFIILLSLFVLVLSFYPIYSRYKSTPPDRVYVGTTYYTADYAGYVSNIEQGIKGRWTYTDKFTTEKVPKTFLYYPYLLLGHIAGILGITSIVMYHLSRFIFGAIYILLIYWLISIIFSSTTKRLIAFTLALFSSSWPTLNSNGVFSVAKLSQAVAEVQVVNRFVIQPHFLLGNIFLLLGLILFLKYLEKPQLKYVFYSSVIVFFTTVFRPSHVILYLGLLAGYSLLRWNFSRRVLRFNIINLIFFLPGFFYLWYLKSHFPSLPYFIYDAQGRNLFNLWDWILLQGPTFLGFLVVIYFFWKKRLTENFKVLFSFVIASLFLLFILPKFYPLNPLRFLQTPMFVVLPILATEAIFKLSRNLSLITLISLITLTISFSTVWLDFKREVNLYYDAYYIWPPKNYLSGLSYLEKESQQSDVVLTYESLANLVPMISGNTVYWGHTNETLDYSKKLVLVDKFYKGQMTEHEAREFLADNNIKYVLVGREERGLGKINYQFLKKVFANLELEVYNSKP